MGTDSFAQNKNSDLLYKYASLPLELRINDLISRMTLEEKVGQINMPCVYLGAFGQTDSEKKQNVEKFARGYMLPGFGPGGGFFTLPNTILHEGTKQQVYYINELQRIAVEETRLGIPLLMIEEGTHGLMCSGATIFPEGPALGSTFNLDLISKIYTAVAREGRAIGVHELFTLVVEPILDPRLGRNEEAYSEDPYYCAEIANTIVRSVQGNDISALDKCIAGLCHFPGQSEPLSGLERGAMDISEYRLRSVFLPPWEAGIKKAGALGVMATYPSINGIPVHASKRLLDDILRKEYGFEGLVFSEGGGIETLIYEGLAEDMKQAGQIAINAGVDVGISFESGFMLDMIESVKEGAIPMILIDRAVRRVLKTKFKLGLFENPYAITDYALAVVHNADHQNLALEAARESIVLLKNDRHILPLSKNEIKSIAVIGPNANDEKNQLGDYTSQTVIQDVITVLEGMRELAPNTNIQYIKGCNVLGNDLNEIEEACKLASKSQVAIVVIGENEWQKNDHEGKKSGTTGEGFDVATLELTGLQQNLVEKVIQTGTPTIVVLVNGRPLATPWIAENASALIEAWIPGEFGGRAVAEIIFGDINPSGKLPVTIPRHAGQLPVYYNYPKSKRYWLEKGWGNSYADINNKPLYNFGYGLSYTSFEFSELTVYKNDGIKISVDIKNTGIYSGKEVVQLYIEDIIASVETPVMELRGFKKVELQPGESTSVIFELSRNHFALFNKEFKHITEPGKFKIMVGPSSNDLRLFDFINID